MTETTRTRFRAATVGFGLLLLCGCGDPSTNPPPADTLVTDTAPETGSLNDSGPPPTGDAPPTTASALLAWLKAGSYTGWEADGVPHQSSGPHGTVRTFLNEALAASLTAGGGSHPVGSAAVKELHGASGVTGWAVSVKVEANGSAQDWYWYETFSTADDATPAADGQGVGLCAGCHGGGSDYVLVPYPLDN